MVHVASSTQVKVKEAVNRQGEALRLRDFLGSSAGGGEGPQAFLVERSNVTLPHFHRVDQFQVVVSGGGRLGKEPLHPVTVHYTDGFTPYGPIVPGPGGDIWFFTLRAQADAGAYYMPESRSKLERKAGRGLTAHVTVRAGQTLYAEGPAATEALWSAHADGLSAFALRAGPGSAATGPDPSTGAGQYYVVVHGSMLHAGTELPLWSCVFVSPDEPPLRIVGGASGLSVLVLQYPNRQPGR